MDGLCVALLYFGVAQRDWAPAPPLKRLPLKRLPLAAC
jgi:hypothetical protein